MKKLFIILYLIILNTLLLSPQSDTKGISVIAKNKSGTFESVKLYDKIHAILIAIDNYPVESGFSVLRYAINDAEGLREVLEKEYNFNSITTLYDSKATRTNILSKFSELNSSKFGDNDALLIFFLVMDLQKK